MKFWYAALHDYEWSEVKLLDDTYFSQLHNILDNSMKELSRMGCIKPCIQARVIMLEDKELFGNLVFWDHCHPNNL